MFTRFFSNMLYVKIYKNKIVVKNLVNNLPPQMFTPDVSFTTHRLLVGTFAPAVHCLKHAVTGSVPNALFKAKPSLLIQPMEMIEGGLSDVEEKILRDCAIGAGARKVVIWIGNELSNDSAIEKLKRSR